MNYADFQTEQGTNGKKYWIAAIEIIPPIAGNIKYEVKYREAKPGDHPHKFLWGNSTWIIDGHYAKSSPTDATRECINKLRQQGIII